MCNRLHTRLRQGSSLVGYFLRQSDDFIVILALLVIAIVFQREPLQDCEKRLDGRNKNSQGSASSSYIGMVLRLSQPFEYRFKFDWIWLPFGIAGLVYLVYGVAVFIVSFGNEGSGVMLFKVSGILPGVGLPPSFVCSIGSTSSRLSL